MTDTGNPNQVSTFQLKVSYWYVSHKRQVRTALIGAMISFCFALWVFVIYQLGVFFVVQGPAELQQLQALTVQNTNYAAIRATQKPAPLQIISVDAINAGGGSFHFVARITNPNNNFVVRSGIAELLVGGTVVDQQEFFVLPGEEKIIVFFEQDQASAGATVSLSQIDWDRAAKDYQEFSQARLQFEISNVDFKTSVESGIRGELPVSILTFDITNRSAFSYWRVGLYAALRSQNRVGAINFNSVEQLESGETQTVEMRWFEPVPPINQVEILPEVDILDADVYMPVS